MAFFQRIKNLWKLSAYRVDESAPQGTAIHNPKLVKNFPTIQKKPAIIILPEKDLLNEEININAETSK